MALIFECIQTDGIAELSYLIGDDSKGVAAVFDPRPDVECYIQLAREKRVSITHIFETHIHADCRSVATAALISSHGRPPRRERCPACRRRLRVRAPTAASDRCR